MGYMRRGFTLIELLVVIAVIAVLMGILMPALKKAKEQGQRAVCVSHLKQLTLAWTLYSDENGGKLVNGEAGNDRAGEKSWIQSAVSSNYRSVNPTPQPEEVQILAIKSGALWPYCNNIKAYSCPTGLRGEFVTYTIMDSMNGRSQGRGPVTNGSRGARVGKTVLWVKQLSEIASPAPALRAVFLDEGKASPDSYAVYYDKAAWWDAPMYRHSMGTAVSWADGHVSSWKWKDQETIRIAKSSDNGTYASGTPSDSQDLQMVQTACWGRLGHGPGK